MMIGSVQRLYRTKYAITGQLVLAGAVVCVTLEPPRDPLPPPDGNGYVCIPAGTYQWTIRWSPKFQRQVPHVEGVPGRTAIEHHIGNWARDTDGCTLYGQDYGRPPMPDYISHSSATFARVMSRLYACALLTNPGADEKHQLWNVGTITYIDPPLGVTQKLEDTNVVEQS